MHNSAKEPERDLSQLPTQLPGEGDGLEATDSLPSSIPLSEQGTVAPLEAGPRGTQPLTAPQEKLDLLASRFRLLKELGKGGMGTVYLAQDELLGLQVAIKMLLPGRQSLNAADRMKAEASLAIRLTHPSIMRIYDLHFTDTDRFIVMEYLKGRPLDAILSERGAIPVRETIEIVQQVASGLDYAHGAGIVHRDIKPANIMLCWEDRPPDHSELNRHAPPSPTSSAASSPGPAMQSRPIAKILDFGIAKAQADVRTGGTRAGTFGYMPPEQFLGKRYDRRVDVFALGVMVYGMLTGEMPFERSGAISPQARPKRIERLSSELNLVLAKAVAWNAADRWSSAGSFVEALVRAFEKELGANLIQGAPVVSKSAVTVRPRTVSLETSIVHATDGAPMVLVEPGSFTMGTN
jgi:serine/threonine-protein kinase